MHDEGEGEGHLVRIVLRVCGLYVSRVIRWSRSRCASPKYDDSTHAAKIDDQLERVRVTVRVTVRVRVDSFRFVSFCVCVGYTCLE